MRNDKPVTIPVLPPVDHLPPADVASMFFSVLGLVPEDVKSDKRFHMAYNQLTRLTDKAIREYKAAGDATRRADAIELGDAPVPPGRVASKGYQLRLATDHLENCLDAAYRAVCAAAILRKKGIGTNANPPDSTAVERLKAIRDAMQHAIERLIGEDLRPGRQPFGADDPYGISPREHELTIGAEQPLSYVELVDLMESCYRAAEIIGGRAKSVASVRVGLSAQPSQSR